MKTFETQSDIAANAETVWHVLTQTLPNDPVPFGILKLDGKIAQGGKIKLWSEVSPNRAFALKVTTLDAPQKMVWQGGMPLGLFTGTRIFTLTEAPQGTRFHMAETFTGPMAPLITKSIPDLTPSFEKFASALKTKAEQQ